MPTTERPQRFEPHEAEAWLARLPPKDQALVRQVMTNHGLTLAEALADLREAGGL